MINEVGMYQCVLDSPLHQMMFAYSLIVKIVKRHNVAFPNMPTYSISPWIQL